MEVKIGVFIFFILICIIGFRFETTLFALIYFIAEVHNYHVEVLAEEDFLRKRHGEKYEKYCICAGRYLPRFYSRELILKICTEGE